MRPVIYARVTYSSVAADRRAVLPDGMDLVHVSINYVEKKKFSANDFVQVFLLLFFFFFTDAILVEPGMDNWQCAEHRGRSCLEHLANPNVRNVCRDYIFALSGLWLAYGDLAGLLSLVSGRRPTWRMLAAAQ